MKKIAILIVTAIALGIILMLIPIAIFTPFLITTKYSQETYPVAGDHSAAPPIQRINDAAQIYGKTDAGPVSFPSSLFYMLLILATGLIAALGTLQYFKRRIK